MKPSEILLKAADLIEAEGWCQNSNVQPDGCMCAWGAIRKAVRQDMGVDSNNLIALYYQLITEQSLVGDVMRVYLQTAGVARTGYGIDNLEASFQSITGWNDTKGRTKDEVIAALRAAGNIEPTPA